MSTKREAFEMFQNLTYEIQRDTVMILFNTRIEIQLQRQMEEPLEAGVEKSTIPR